MLGSPVFRYSRTCTTRSQRSCLHTHHNSRRSHKYRTRSRLQSCFHSPRSTQSCTLHLPRFLELCPASRALHQCSQCRKLYSTLQCFLLTQCTHRCSMTSGRTCPRIHLHIDRAHMCKDLTWCRATCRTSHNSWTYTSDPQHFQYGVCHSSIHHE